MQTIIMAVGTSLRTNPDRELPQEQKWPWVNHADRFKDCRIFTSLEEPLVWMATAAMELISAETHTLWRLDPEGVFRKRCQIRLKPLISPR